MTQNHRQKLVAFQQPGSVNELLMSKYSFKLPMNEGDNKYMIKTVISPSILPILKDTDITVFLTDPNMHIIEFQNSYFTLELTIDVIFSGGFPLFFGDKPDFIPNFDDPDEVYPKWKDLYTSTSPPANSFDKWIESPIYQDLAKMQFIFFGFKAATDVISKITVQWNSLDISDTTTDKYQYQSFYINMVKPKLEKENKKNIHTLWEEAHDFNQTVCGQYVSYWELYQAYRSGSNKIVLSFPVNIKFDDILHFLAMDEFPNSVFGDLKLVFQVSPDALVWTPVDPKKSIEKLLETYVPNESDYKTGMLGQSPFSFISQVANQMSNCDFKYMYDKRFFNQRSWGRAPMNVMGYSIGDVVQLATYYTRDISIQVEGIKVNAAASTISGFKLKHSYIDKLKKYYTDKPMVVPSEKIRYNNYANNALANGIEVSCQFPIRNAKELVFLYPRTAFDMTCFCNPILDSYYVQIQNENYPSVSTSTVSPDFYNQQLIAASLGGILACTESFETSNTCIPLWSYPGRDRVHHDNTEFAHLLILERPSANCYNQDSPLTFDVQTTVTISGRFPTIKDSNNGNHIVDNYYIINRQDRKPGATEPSIPGIIITGSPPNIIEEHNNTPPIMLAISDSFWIFQYNQPPKYITNKTWDETLYTYFPSLYEQLVSLVNG
jgi:hypothetical protein